jgi:hypothetical protein
MARRGFIVVLDVGKSLSKLTLWSPERQMVARRTRANLSYAADGFVSLDVPGITAWLAQGLTEFAGLGDIAAIIPAAHGAAACLVDAHGLSAAPLDYDAKPPMDIRRRYQTVRDPFALTGSPCLPGGLNLGAQFYWLEKAAPERMRDAQILTWPQYWSWALCGIAATEVTSLGCHSDLWMPIAGEPSPLAVSRGWRRSWRRCVRPAKCWARCRRHGARVAACRAIVWCYAASMTATPLCWRRANIRKLQAGPAPCCPPAPGSSPCAVWRLG